MPLSFEQFQQQIRESGLIPADELAALLDALPADRKADGEQLARELVRQRKLTAFQAQQIYQGKGKHLVLGNYVALDKLGQGGMGMVLKAEHRRMKRLVALKVLSPNVTKTPEALRRFQREVEAAAKLNHTNIVTAFDADEAAGTRFLVMEYVEGTDLSDLVKKNGPLAIDKALTCVIQAARGLDYAHSRGVVHRDIKPANLLLDRDGTIKILDMGLARLDSAGGQQDQLTGTGQIMGTVDYMAPEQAMDTKSADARADIYSLGVTLWHLLTGRALYDGDTTVMKLMAHQNKPIPSLRAACPAVSVDLEAVFTRMVAKTPEARYQSMKDVIVDLERCQGGQAVAPSVSAGPGEDSRLSEFLRGMSPAGGASRQAAAVAAPVTTAQEQTVNLTDAQIGTDPQTQRSLPRSVALALTGRSAARATWLDRLPVPPKYRLPVLIGGGVAAAALLLMGILLFWQTDQGTVRIEINDPNLTAQIDGQGAKITQLDKDPIELSPGQHGLRIKAGDLEFETDKFVLADGDDVRLKIELLNGQVRVANGDDVLPTKQLASAAPAAAPAPSVPENSGTNATDPPGAPAATGTWQALFNGTSFDGWQNAAGGAVPANWKIEDNAISATGRGTNIATTAGYGDFELEFEWRVSAGANGGVYYGWDGSPKLFETTLEYQVVDNQGHPNGKKPETAAGSVYGLYGPNADVTKSVGEWNRARVVVRGDQVEHWLNDQRIVSCTLGDETWRQRTGGRTQLAQALGTRGGGRGRFALQSNGGTVAYRNLRIRPAGPPSAPSDDGAAWHGWPADAPAPAIAPFDAAQAKKHQQEWADHLGVPVEYENSIGMKFVLIPPGEFTMGSAPAEIEAALVATGNDDFWKAHIRSEAPRHKVVLTKAFYLGMHEVTQENYQSVMGSNPSYCAATGSGKDAVANLDTRNHPVEQVNWLDAARFCARLSEQEGRRPFYSPTGEIVSPREGAAYRLPTEAEWEFACRAGTSTRFWSGDQDEDLARVAWYNSNCKNRTHPIGELTPNPLGLFDIHGNVWEWVQDWWDSGYYGQFAEQPTVDPGGPSSAGVQRVYRGGNWAGQPSDCRCAPRYAGAPTAVFRYIGFRVALGVDAVKARNATEPIDSDRQAVEKLLPHAYAITLQTADGRRFAINKESKDPLPAGPFQVVALNFIGFGPPAGFTSDMLLPALAGLKSLEAIERFGEGSFTTAELARLAEMPCAANLTSFEVGICELDKDNLDLLQRFPKLTSLGLRAGRPTAKLLERLKQEHPLVRKLRLSDWGVDAPADQTSFDALATLPLEEIAFARRGTIEPGLCRAIATMPDLRTVQIKVGGVGDNVLRELGHSRSMESLAIEFTDATDELLPILGGMPKLVSVNVWGTKMTEAALKKFVADHPNIQVVASVPTK